MPILTKHTDFSQFLTQTYGENNTNDHFAHRISPDKIQHAHPFALIIIISLFGS